MKSRIVLLITAAWIGGLSTAFATLQWPMTVENISELKSLHLADVIAGETAFTTSTRPAVYVKGYYSPGDRGGGLFEWDANSGGVPDDGRYIATNGWSSGNGRWVRLLNGEVANVKMWGALGTGAGDDTIAIQKAVNALSYYWTEELLFPTGLYSLTNTILFPCQVHLRGDGSLNGTFIQMHGSNDVFRTFNAQTVLTNGPIGDDHGLNFESMAIIMDTNATGNAALVVCNPGEACTIRDLQTFGGGYGIRSWGSGAPGLQISYVKVNDPYVAGVCLEGVLPNGTFVGFIPAMSLNCLSGDHHRPDSDATASLVRINKGAGACSVYDFKAEGTWGAGYLTTTGLSVSRTLTPRSLAL
jgi:pectate lyase-like protein